MSYEFSSESKRLDLPNPFKIENYFYFALSIIMVGVAVWLLMISRSAISSNATFSSYLPLFAGIFLLYQGIKYARWALTQLRFFFGRGEPKDISVITPSNSNLAGTPALKETIRQNALPYEEPHGPLNGLLYSWIPNLIFAPTPIQHLGQRQFHNALAIIAVIASLSLSWISLADQQAALWMGLFFYLFSMYIVIKPIKVASNKKSELGVNGLVVLILIAILSPVILPKVLGHMPPINLVDLIAQTFVLLVLGLISIVLFFIALIKQMVPAPKTTSACKQQSLSINCSPVQLLDEISRELQKNWTEQIPNRQYSKVLPDVKLGLGEFSSEILEETQPMPNEELRQLTFQSALTNPRYRSLVWLDIAGLVIAILGVMYIVYFVKQFDVNSPDLQLITKFTFGAGLLFLSGFCFSSAHELWGRFDFVSKLTWVEMMGNYQSAKMDFGNVLTDRIKTEKNVVNVENMTLRVWVCELDTLALNKQALRHITAMRGLPDESANLAQHIAQFAANQSIIVAPESIADQQKIANLGAINQANQPSQIAPINAIQYQTATHAQQKNTCTQCFNELAVGAKFCAHCGTKIE